MTRPRLNEHQIAYQHWEYNKELILKLDPTLDSINEKYLKLMEYFYVEAFKHGYKHAKGEK